MKIFKRLPFVFVLLLIAFAPPPSDNEWLPLDEVRVTFYGPEYVAGDVTASGVRYAPDNKIVALGPYHLQVVRDYYEADGLLWEWLTLPGRGRPYLSFQSRVGSFPRHPCFICEPDQWGFWVRVCSAGHCELLRVADTGSARLEADLPDETWLEFGYPASQGVFTGTLEVRREW